MLYCATLFLAIALAAGFFGFGSVASTAASIAQVLFFLFIVAFLAALVLSLFRGHARAAPDATTAATAEPPRPHS